MSEPLRIPIHAPRIDAHGDRYEVIDSYATITPDLARQIVALGGGESLAHRIDTIVEGQTDLNVGYDKRISALEAKSGKHEVIIGSGLEPDAKPQPVADDAPCADDTCEIERLRDSLALMASQSAQYMKERDAIKAQLADADRYRRSSDKELADAREAAGKALADIAALRAELAAERRNDEATKLLVTDMIEECDTARERCAVLEGLLKELRWDMGDIDGLPQGEYNCLLRRIDAALAGKDKP